MPAAPALLRFVHSDVRQELEVLIEYAEQQQAAPCELRPPFRGPVGHRAVNTSESASHAAAAA
jgi:hypothetical protein